MSRYDEIRARLAALKGLPWSFRKVSADPTITHVIEDADSHTVAEITYCDSPTVDESDSRASVRDTNAEFIAAAPELVGKLLDECERLQKELLRVHGANAAVFQAALDQVEKAEAERDDAIARAERAEAERDLNAAMLRGIQGSMPSEIETSAEYRKFKMFYLPILQRVRAFEEHLLALVRDVETENPDLAHGYRIAAERLNVLLRLPSNLPQIRSGDETEAGDADPD